MKKLLSILFFCFIAVSGFADYKCYSIKINEGYYSQININYEIIDDEEIFTISNISLSLDNLCIFHNALIKAKEWKKIAEDNKVESFYKSMNDLIFYSRLGVSYTPSFTADLPATLSIYPPVTDYETYINYSRSFYLSDIDDLIKYTDIEYLREFAKQENERIKKEIEEKKRIDALFN